MPQTTLAEVGQRAARSQPRTATQSLLCVANFSANTGYAWDFIEGLYARVADRLAGRGVTTWVAYPAIPEPPRSLASSKAEAVELTVRPQSYRSMRATVEFVKRHNVKVVYLADRASWHPAYALLRRAGVQRIVVHDHTSGERSRPRGAKRAVKWVTRRLFRSMMADILIGVSDYVARRKVEIDLVPPDRVHRVWNSLEVPEADEAARDRLRGELQAPADALVVACACRAAPEKGVEHLLRAFERVRKEGPRGERVVLVYMGEGPDLDRLKAIHGGLQQKERIVLMGYRADARELLAGADVCVVPSVWEEAFGLSALEPMARGVPVVATRVGGLPEIVVEGETGLLVAPGTEADLAHAIDRLLGDPALREKMGENGRRRAAEHFGLDGEIDELVRLLEPGFRFEARDK